MEDVIVVHDRLALEGDHQGHAREDRKSGGVGTIGTEALNVQHIWAESSRCPLELPQALRAQRYGLHHLMELCRWERHGETAEGDPLASLVGGEASMRVEWCPYLDGIAGLPQRVGEVPCQLFDTTYGRPKGAWH